MFYMILKIVHDVIYASVLQLIMISKNQSKSENNLTFYIKRYSDSLVNLSRLSQFSRKKKFLGTF